MKNIIANFGWVFVLVLTLALAATSRAQSTPEMPKHESRYAHLDDVKRTYSKYESFVRTIRQETKAQDVSRIILILERDEEQWRRLWDQAKTSSSGTISDQHRAAQVNLRWAVKFRAYLKRL